ncbi:MAG: MFS transporter [Thiopseudomonas sp.]|nr:MFS transporter [Thiopseudomonas sp.]
MKSLRFNISNSAHTGIAAGLWQLCQTLWVGAQLSCLLLFMPVLKQMGLAQLLITEVSHKLWPGLLALTLMCLLLQWLVLWRCLPRQRWLRDGRTLLLGLACVGCLLQLVIFNWVPASALLLKLAQGGLLGCGLLLVMQPSPQSAARATA